MLGAVMAGATIAAAGHAVLLAPRRLRVARIDAPIRGLPSAFDGYTIAALGDIHHGSVVAPTRHLRRAIRLTQRERPDLVALLGDYALSHRALPRTSRRLYEYGLRALSPVLRELHAPDGVVAVLGNHDYDYDAPAVAEWLRTLGARVLVNHCVRLTRGDGSLVVAGVDDATYGRIDPLAGCGGEPAETPRIVLSHNPDGIRALAPEARVDLMLSGHTHGGQVVIPFLGAPARHCVTCGPRCASGWVPNDRAALYVTTGVGVVLPFRVRCPPEVLIVRLRAARG
ncbi:MAG TPA: metallophosphoesterase [Gemmatimonadaceae bacterium]|nr:metallophosphoesterase [Gemmatimonadaceae bacterium]